MYLPKDEILRGAYEPEELKNILSLAEKAIKEWDLIWSHFLSPRQIEEYLPKLKIFSDLSFIPYGGHENSQRQKLGIFRKSLFLEAEINSHLPELKGLNISGNFLFDKAKAQDFRLLINDLGLPKEEIGDILVNGDKGAQAIITMHSFSNLKSYYGLIRDIPVELELIELNSIKYPSRKKSRTFFTIESSTRLDSIASAGFNMSRSKIVDKIKCGLLSVNWKNIMHPSAVINQGDKIQFQDKGVLEIVKIEKTKRQRYKINMTRH